LWGRSYLANGRQKDPAFQLDQQLFPLVELAEYVEATGERELWERLSLPVRQVVAAICSREVPGNGLFPTDETPADDPVAMPYHLSSHILLWHTFRKLAALIEDDRLTGVIQRAFDAIWRDFVAEYNGRKRFAYLTDGAGQRHFYHDANDLPLALAPAWGFCRLDDPVWRATMDFAFSPDNVGGFYLGPYGGLGSVHTPEPWPLGDIQAYIVASLTGDKSAKKAVVERLNAVAQYDGALPEAYSASGGRVASRHWFSWPGGALNLCLNQLRRREQ
jgi:meiotically up-regulated gene 157 (Mug157) protein